METPVLRNNDIYPDDDVLKKALGDCYPVLEKLFDTLNKTEYRTVSGWKYYNDGKSWLCRTEYKKKTLFWLSVWKEYFKVSFYFTEKNTQDILSLKIDHQVTENFLNCKPIGKLLPLVFIVTRKEQINDIMKAVDYKINHK